MTPVSFLASKFPGRSEQEYRNHLGSFGLTGVLISTHVLTHVSVV